MTSVDEIWGSVCEKLRETLMPPIYKVWITPLSLVSFDGRAVDIVASEMAQKVLRQQCYNELLEAFRETVGFDVELNFITEAQTFFRDRRIILFAHIRILLFAVVGFIRSAPFVFVVMSITY